MSISLRNTPSPACNSSKQHSPGDSRDKTCRKQSGIHQKDCRAAIKKDHWNGTT